MLPRSNPPAPGDATRRSPVWHRLPWNALFWGFTILLLGAAAYFAIQVQIRRHTHVAEAVADIADGDTVDVVLVLNGEEIMVMEEAKRARVRMLGIHSFDPLVNEREITGFGRASVAFLESWTLNEAVRLRFGPTTKDVRGRYLTGARACRQRKSANRPKSASAVIHSQACSMAMAA